MSRKGQSITLSLSPVDKARLEALAVEFGKMWGDRPNISKLIEAIARRQLQLTPNDDWSNLRIQALYLGFRSLISTGKLLEATEIGNMLCDRAELAPSQKTEIEQFLQNPLPPWQAEISRLLQARQPFRLSYRDPADRLCTYTVLHGRFVQVFEYPYLLCRCEESIGNTEVAGLEQNWQLRLDRIQEAVVVPINQPWQMQLAEIVVEFKLFGATAFAYETRQEDEFVGFLKSDPPVKRVIRSISSSQQFFQEIAVYGADCAVIAPEAIRKRFITNLEAQCAHYEIVRDLG